MMFLNKFGFLKAPDVAVPQLISFYNQAELVSMVLRWLPEDITVHNEDLEGLS